MRWRGRKEENELRADGVHLAPDVTRRENPGPLPAFLLHLGALVPVRPAGEDGGGGGKPLGPSSPQPWSFSEKVVHSCKASPLPRCITGWTLCTVPRSTLTATLASPKSRWRSSIPERRDAQGPTARCCARSRTLCSDGSC